MYGGEDDLWGTEWTAEDVNSGLGVEISVSSVNSLDEAYIEYAELTVYYTSNDLTSMVSVPLYDSTMLTGDSYDLSHAVPYTWDAHDDSSYWVQVIVDEDETLFSSGLRHITTNWTEPSIITGLDATTER